MQKITLDTNILLETPDILDDPEARYVVPWVVLKELDGLKRHRQELGFATREAIRAIHRNIDTLEIDMEGYVPSTNDDHIIDSALRNGKVLYTEDVAMTVLAQHRGVEVKNPLTQERIEADYRGFLEVSIDDGDDEALGEFYQNRTYPAKTLQRLIVGEENIPHPNEFLILRHQDVVGGYQYNPETELFERRYLSGGKLKLKNYTLDPMDIYQTLAICSSINLNTALTVIDGPVGSGKSLLALAAALYLVEKNQLKKIYITRPPVGIDDKYDIGFLPGSADEKLAPWIGGVISNLSYLYGEGAKSVFESNFEHFPVNTAQGYSIHKSVLIVDEAQLLSTNVMKQIISRVADGSKLILLGDNAQTYNIVSRTEMGFERLKKLLPTQSVEYIRLQKIYRGKLAELSINL